MPIPTIPGTAQVQDTQIGSKVNVQPRLRALGEARQAFGEANAAIQGGIGMVQDYEERKRKAEEAGFFNKTAIATMSATSTFRHGIKTMPDDQIVPNWTTAAAAVKQTQLEDPTFQKMSPKAQQALRINLDKWQGQSTGEFQVAADRLGSKRRNATAVAAKAAFLKTGDPAMKTNAVAALQGALKAGDMTKDQYDYEVKGMDEQLEKNQILNGIDSNAYSTLQDIKAGKFKNVSEMDLNTLRNQAERQVNYEQRTNSGDLINDYATSGVAKPDKELNEMVKAGKVTGEFRKSYQAMVARDDYKIAEDKQALLLNDLHDLDLENSDNPEKDVREITDEAGSLPPQLQKQIHALAASKLKAAKSGTPLESPIQKDAVRQLREESAASVNSREAIDRRGGTYLLPDEEITARGGNPKDRIGFAESQKVIAAKQEGELRQWFKDYAAAHQNKPPAPEEVSAERMRILKPSVTDMVKQALSKPPTE